MSTDWDNFRAYYEETWEEWLAELKQAIGQDFALFTPEQWEECYDDGMSVEEAHREALDAKANPIP